MRNKKSPHQANFHTFHQLYMPSIAYKLSFVNPLKCVIENARPLTYQLNYVTLKIYPFFYNLRGEYHDYKDQQGYWHY